MSADQYDNFDDIINGQAGVFSPEAAAIDPGLKSFDSTRTVATPEGVVVEMFCRGNLTGNGCGRPRQFTIEWPEMVAIVYNISPHEAYQGQSAGGRPIVQEMTVWDFDPRGGAWYPKQPCRNCRTLLMPLFTPQEAEGHLVVARQRGWIHPQGEQFCRTLAAQAYQRKAARMAGR